MPYGGRYALAAAILTSCATLAILYWRRRSAPPLADRASGRRAARKKARQNKGGATEGSPSVIASFSVAADGQTRGTLLCSELPREFPSLGVARRLLGSGQVHVQGQPVTDDTAVLARGDLVEYVLSTRPRQHGARSGGLGPPSLRLEWVHMDDHVAVCVKPQGIAVQGDESATRLRHAVGWDLPPPNHRPDALAVPRPVHRIDKATGALHQPEMPTECGLPACGLPACGLP